MEEQLNAAIVAALDEKLGYYQQQDGTFLYEIYADYRDKMDSKTEMEYQDHPRAREDAGIAA